MFSVARHDEPVHVLVPLDFSETTESALRRARELSRALEARLTLLHVRSDSLDDQGAGLNAIGHLHRVLESSPRDPNCYLPVAPLSHRQSDPMAREMEAAAQVAMVDSLDVETAWRTGPPAREIIAYADEHEVDMIIMGVDGGRASRTTLLGSVADEVVRRASCPVMVVRDPAKSTGRVETYHLSKLSTLPAAIKEFFARAGDGKALRPLKRLFGRRRRRAVPQGQPG